MPTCSHVTTTPSVAYVARVDAFDCGSMISASHNPYYDNGIKLINGQGEKMDEETISLVEAYLDGDLNAFGQHWDELPFATRDKIGCTVDYISGRNRYIGYLISLGMYSFRGVKVGLDCANGSSWNIAKAVFDALGATTYVINAEPNGLNINLNAGSTHIEGLQKFVVEKGLDIGFAYDGDADRCLCVDEKGEVITGDHILYIYGRYMKERGKLINNTVVTTVMSNFGLYKALDELGIGYAKTKVGDKYVYEYMHANGCRHGRRAERPHHLLQVRLHRRRHPHQPQADGSRCWPSKKTHEPDLCRLLADLSPGAGERQSHRQDRGPERSPMCRQAVKAVAARPWGIPAAFWCGNPATEPLVRVMVEAPEHETCQKYVDSVVEVIRDKGYAVE